MAVGTKAKNVLQGESEPAPKLKPYPVKFLKAITMPGEIRTENLVSMALTMGDLIQE